MIGNNGGGRWRKRGCVTEVFRWIIRKCGQKRKKRNQRASRIRCVCILTRKQKERRRERPVTSQEDRSLRFTASTQKKC